MVFHFISQINTTRRMCIVMAVGNFLHASNLQAHLCTWTLIYLQRRKIHTITFVRLSVEVYEGLKHQLYRVQHFPLRSKT